MEGREIWSDGFRGGEEEYGGSCYDGEVRQINNDDILINLIINSILDHVLEDTDCINKYTLQYQQTYHNNSF